MISVTLVFSPGPREVIEQVLSLPEASTASAALKSSDLPTRFPELDWNALSVGVWGRVATWEQPLQGGDRIEICRPLTVDPKVARRERFAQQGVRGTGLFANRRKGGKAGY